MTFELIERYHCRSVQVNTMPAGYIIFDAREFAYGRLIKMKEEFMRITSVDNIRFTDDKRTGKEDLFRVGTIGKTENVRAALDLIKDEAMARGSSVGK